MVKKKQKVYLSVGILLLQTTLMADGLASILISQKTKDTVIENNNFEGESVYSFLWGKTDFFSSSLGSYVTIGGTVDFRSDEDKKSDEESGDFDNYKSYNVYNTGLTYAPTNNFTLLGGLGYGESKGKYYQQNTTSSDYTQLSTEKEKGVNFNLGINYYYKSIGLVAMYDTFPKVFSVGVSYNFGTTNTSNTKQIKKISSPKKESWKPLKLINKTYERATIGVGALLGARDGRGVIQGAIDGKKLLEEDNISKVLNTLEDLEANKN